MPNFVKIGGVTRKPLVDLTRNDPKVKLACNAKICKARFPWSVFWSGFGADFGAYKVGAETAPKHAPWKTCLTEKKYGAKTDNIHFFLQI